MTTPLLEVTDLSKRFGGVFANEGISFAVAEGEVVGIIGPNGAGKTTLYNCLTGFLAPERGRIRLAGRDVTGLSPSRICRQGLVRTFQIEEIFADMTVLQNIMVGAFAHTGSVSEARAASERILADSGMQGLAAKADLPARQLTTIEKRLLQILRAMATRPRLLLLDEALAGLTPTEIEQALVLIRRLRQQGITLMVIEHVMQVIMDLSQRIIVLDSGQKIADGLPADVVRDERVVKAYLGENHHVAAL